MSYEIAKTNLITDFRGLQSPKYLPNLTPLAHQLEAAETVIERMNGKAILADEVGLGKTIEAGLILERVFNQGSGEKSVNFGSGISCQSMDRGNESKISHSRHPV